MRHREYGSCFSRCFLTILRETYSNFRHSGLAVLITLSVVTFSSFVAGLTVLFSVNVHKLLDYWRERMCVYVLLKHDIIPTKVTRLVKELQRYPGVKEVVFRAPQDSLKSFNELFAQDGELFVGKLGVNPFPPMFDVFINKQFSTMDQVDNFVKQCKKDSAVLSAFYDRFIIAKLHHLMQTSKFLIYFIVFLLGIPSALIISNTVRLATIARAREIMLMRLFGATEAFIKAPILLEGFLHGCFGGLLAITVLWVGYQTFWSYFVQKLNLSTIFLQRGVFLSFYNNCAIVGCASMLGLCGSFLGMRGELNNLLSW